MSVIAPIVHLNGTSRQMLMDELEEAYYALGNAYDKVKASGPNGRDYYLMAGLFEKAVKQHTDRLEAIEGVRRSIAEQLTTISDQP